MKGQSAIGFTIKSGWAAAVLLAAAAKAPRVIDSRRIELSDPDIPESRQPYHEGFGTARVDRRALFRLLRSVRKFGMRSVNELVREHDASGHHCVGAALVVGSLADPERIANDHIRIHALEGQLFRGVVADAAAAAGLPCSVWRERDLYADAAKRLETTEPRVRATVAALGNGVRPWRTEQKAAALAAWLALTGAASE